ncbi:MAG: hypothetical protein KAJ66_03765 [Candidatus Omnitrophica bacterium]|nr:hypothetical protein [Candidatus Omnitrophota bacterium]
MRKTKHKLLVIECELRKDGLRLKVNGRNFDLSYPGNIWAEYPQECKNFLVDNLVYTLTANIPLVAPTNSIIYKNISTPLIKPYVDLLTIEGIPSAINSYDDGLLQTLKRHNNVSYLFKDEKVKYPPEWRLNTRSNKAIVPLSFGKDSLATLGILREAGVDPICLYINDTESPSENRLKLKMAQKISAEQGIGVNIITNQIEKLCDFEFWNTKESCLGYIHMILGFCLMALPFVHYYKAKYIIMGNQQDMNFPFISKNGFLTYPAPDQSLKWQRYINQIIGQFTSNNTAVTSVITPLTNLFLMGLLHQRYPYLGQYEVSCDSLDAGNEPRWCCNCSKCARLSIFMKAFGMDTKKIGYKSDMLDIKHKRLYSCLGGLKTDQYEVSQQSKEQQQLAFYMAYKRGEKGRLIDFFLEKHLKTLRIVPLKNKYLKIYKAEEIPCKLKNKILPIYKEQLKVINTTKNQLFSLHRPKQHPA